MIPLTRLNHLAFMLNPDRILHVESTPDTVVVMDNGERFMVLETADVLVERVIEFRRRIGLRSVYGADEHPADKHAADKDAADESSL